MREWQVGDPVGDGNDIGVPDTKYMGYLKYKQMITAEITFPNPRNFRMRHGSSEKITG